MKMKIRTMLVCCLLMLLALTACGGGGAVGTWYLEEDEAVILVLERGGRALLYDSDYDETEVGSWTEADYGVLLTVDGERLRLQADGKDILKGSGVTFLRGEDAQVPLITFETLYWSSWEDYGAHCSLMFSSDGSWMIADYESYNILYQGDADSADIDGDEIILTTQGGEKITLKVSEDATVLAGPDDMTFVKD